MQTFKVWTGRPVTGVFRFHQPWSWACGETEHSTETDARHAVPAMAALQPSCVAVVLPTGQHPDRLADVPGDDPPRLYRLWFLPHAPGSKPCRAGDAFPSIAAALATLMKPEVGTCKALVLPDGVTPVGTESPHFVKLVA